MQYKSRIIQLSIAFQTTKYGLESLGKFRTILHLYQNSSIQLSNKNAHFDLSEKGS